MFASLDPEDIRPTAAKLSRRLHNELKAGRLIRIDVDVIRAAIAGWATHAVLTTDQLEALEKATTLRVVMDTTASR